VRKPIIITIIGKPFTDEQLAKIFADALKKADKKPDGGPHA
jgi:hypothetical protein